MLLYFPAARSSSTISSRKFNDFCSSFLISSLGANLLHPPQPAKRSSPFTKQQAADPYHRTPLFHRYFVVAAHSHGKDAAARKPTVEQTFQRPEFRSHRTAIRCIRGHPHQSTYTHGRPPALRRLSDLIRAESEFRFLARDMHLQEHVDRPAAADRLPFDLLQQADAVHTLYEMNERQDMLHLVRLQMTDKMPMNIGR